jgi:hypothetical protein
VKSSLWERSRGANRERTPESDRAGELCGSEPDFRETTGIELVCPGRGNVQLGVPFLICWLAEYSESIEWIYEKLFDDNIVMILY